MSFKIKSLPLLEYCGFHRDELKFYFGFKKRLIANDYTHKSKGSIFEQFYYQVIILERLEKLLLRDTAFHNLSDSARNKLTQLLIVVNDIVNKTNAMETEINQKNVRKFNLTEDYFRVLNLIELFILKLISFLDILSRISANIFKVKKGKKSFNTYGKQKAFNTTKGEFINYFDHVYQRRLLKNNIINELHKYRNKFSHKSSLKLIPYFRNNKCTLTFGEGTKEGIKIKEAVIKSMNELSRFINYFEKYYVRFFNH